MSVSHCGSGNISLCEASASSGTKAMAQLVVPRSMPMLNLGETTNLNRGLRE